MTAREPARPHDDRVSAIVVGALCAFVIVRGVVPALLRGESVGAAIGVLVLLAVLLALVLRPARVGALVQRWRRRP